MTDIKDFKNIIKVTTSVQSFGCELCKREFLSVHDIAYIANHYIKDHGYFLLHVGQESQWNHEVNPHQQWNDSVIILGK